MAEHVQIDKLLQKIHLNFIGHVKSTEHSLMPVCLCMLACHRCIAGCVPSKLLVSCAYDSASVFVITAHRMCICQCITERNAAAS